MSRHKVKQRKKKHSRQPSPFQNSRVTSSQRIQFSRPETSGREQVVIVPEFAPTDPRSTILRTPQGSNGNYRVTFVLSIPGKEYFRDEIDLPMMMQSGNSLLLMPQEAVEVKVRIFNELESKEIIFSKNADGAVSSAQIRLYSSSFVDAEAQAFDLVMPILSWWSYRYDVALDIAGYEVYEEQTDVQKWTFGLVGKAKALDFNIGGASKPEYRAVFAAYREAVNAINPYYQLLCYYKVIEGVKNLRDRRRRATLAAGESYREPANEHIPAMETDIGISDPFILEMFKPYLGRKFTWVMDQLRDVLRNAIAHLEPTGNSLVADKFENVVKCELAIPVIKYISRIMLGNEINADPDLAAVHIS